MPTPGWPPYSPEDVIPFGMLPQGPAGLPEPDFGPTTPEAIPDDFWARMAQGAGPQPFGQIQTGRKPTGLEIILALAAGFANAKAAGGARRVGQAEQRNTEVKANARALALHRHQMAREALQQQGATERTRITQQGINNRRPSEPLVVVQTPTGRQYVPRREAAGKPAPTPPPKAPPRTGPTPAQAKADSLRGVSDKRREFNVRKRAVMGDVHALDKLFGEKRKAARERLADYLSKNPDLKDDPEVMHAIERAPR
jgi:hypothetical protein